AAPQTDKRRSSRAGGDEPVIRSSSAAALRSLVPSARFERAHTAPEADALSPELRGRGLEKTWEKTPGPRPLWGGRNASGELGRSGLARRRARTCGGRARGRLAASLLRTSARSLVVRPGRLDFRRRWPGTVGVVLRRERLRAR